MLLAVRELAGVLLFGERLVIHSAHEWRTVSEQFAATLDLVEGLGAGRYKARVRKTGGEESITFTNGARIRFMNRSRESARGFSADVVDPGRGARADAWSRPGRCCRCCRPAGRRAGVVRGRGPGAGRVAAGAAAGTGGVGGPGQAGVAGMVRGPGADDLDDPAVWAAANPAVASGRLSTERMAEERATLGPIGFAAERLAAAPWPSEMAGSWSTFTEQEWEAMTS